MHCIYLSCFIKYRCTISCRLSYVVVAWSVHQLHITSPNVVLNQLWLSDVKYCAQHRQRWDALFILPKSMPMTKMILQKVSALSEMALEPVIPNQKHRFNCQLSFRRYSPHEFPVSVMTSHWLLQHLSSRAFAPLDLTSARPGFEPFTLIQAYHHWPELWWYRRAGFWLATGAAIWRGNPSSCTPSSRRSWTMRRTTVEYTPYRLVWQHKQQTNSK